MNMQYYAISVDEFSQMLPAEISGRDAALTERVLSDGYMKE